MVYNKGSVASVIAHIVSEVWRSGHDFVKDFSIPVADIFHGDENPNPVALTTALEWDTSRGKPTWA